MLLVEGVGDRGLVMGPSPCASLWALLGWTGRVATSGRSTAFFFDFLLVFVLVVYTVI